MLFALGIRYVGETTAKEIAAHFKDIDHIAEASYEELLQIPDVGEVIAKSVSEFFKDERHRLEIQRLKADGLKMSLDAPEQNLSSSLEGKVIVISGNFSVSRNEMKRTIELHGGKNSSSISGKTSFLLAGIKPGPEKIKKAGELGIPVISEEEFAAMLPAGTLPEGETESEDDAPNLFNGMI